MSALDMPSVVAFATAVEQGGTILELGLATPAPLDFIARQTLDLNGEDSGCRCFQGPQVMHQLLKRVNSIQERFTTTILARKQAEIVFTIMKSSTGCCK